MYGSEDQWECSGVPNRRNWVYSLHMTAAVWKRIVLARSESTVEWSSELLSVGYVGGRGEIYELNQSLP